MSRSFAFDKVRDKARDKVASMAYYHWRPSVASGAAEARLPVPRVGRHREFAHLAALVGFVLFFALQSPPQDLLHLRRCLFWRFFRWPLLLLLLFLIVLVGLGLWLLLLLLLLVFPLLRGFLVPLFALGQQLSDTLQIFKRL